MLLLLVACAGGGDEPASVVRQAAGDPTAIADLSVHAPEAQTVLLADGHLSDGEYESAIQAERDCAAAAGYEPAEVSWHGGELGFETTATYEDEDEADPEAADNAFTATIDDYRTERSSLVAAVWAAEH